MYPTHNEATLRRFFAGLSEYIFETRLGVVDPPLVDYLAELLSRFIRMDAIFSVRNPAGRRLEELAQMILEAGQRVGDAQRNVHRHIGDVALFWTGVFPEALRPRHRSRVDHFIDYCEQGKRSYFIASTLPAPQENAAENDLLARLSHEFELCAYGLHEVRREWERRDETGDKGPLVLE